MSLPVALIASVATQVLCQLFKVVYYSSRDHRLSFKYFFTSAIGASNGHGALSAEAVRFRIKSLIDAEADDVLSDDKIVSILVEEGVDIARRTVAKYRESLRIPSSVQRRRERSLRVRPGELDSPIPPP